MKIALITGITGQDGYYLTRFLLQKKYTIFGVVRRTSELYCSSRIDKLSENIELNYGDLTDELSLNSIISNIINNNEFDIFEIYNLAAQSHVGISFNLPSYTNMVNAIGTLNLLEIIRNIDIKHRNKIKFYQAGTSELYGDVLETPQNERTQFNPISPYAVSKQFAYQITEVYKKSFNIFAVNGILFNHESPMRGKNFVTMKIINFINNIGNNKQEYIELGNIYSKRDWGHADDYVKGMWLMMQNKNPTNYVLATGKTYTVKEFVEKAFKFKGYNITWRGSGIDEKGIDQNNIVRIKISEKYFRPHDVELLLGDSTKARKELNWTPEYDTLDKIIEDMFKNIN